MSVAAAKDRRKIAIVFAAAGVVVLAGSMPMAYAGGGSHGNHNRNDSFRATLTGAAEVPGPGDPDGRGAAKISVKRDRICFTVSWRNIDGPPPALGPVAAHIHVGSSTVAGPVVLDLLRVPPPGLGLPVSEVSGCATANSNLITAIRQNPRNYYVNVHTVPYPAGAIRGQLR